MAVPLVRASKGLSAKAGRLHVAAVAPSTAMSQLGLGSFAAAARVPVLPCVTGIGRRYMSSAAPASPAAAESAAGPPPAQPPSEYTFFVQQAGAKSWAEMTCSSASSVARTVKDIKEELELDAPLGRITLQLAAKRKDGKDQLVPLDSMDTIAEALPKAFEALKALGITPEEKLRFIVDVAAPAAPAAGAPAGGYRVAASGPPTFPPLPPALSLTDVTLGGETWLETVVPRTSTGATSTAPVFFTADQIKAVREFIRQEPTEDPQALMLVGTIKSGKSTLLRKVLPGLIAAEHASGEWQPLRPRPVIFEYSFPAGADAETAAMDLGDAVDDFARKANVPFVVPPSARAALNTLPLKLSEFCKRVAGGGGELWLLLDELQGPGLNSTSSVAAQFTDKFKMLVEKCSPFARIAVTGSGLVALLNSFRTAHVNGFALWDAVAYVGLGSSPSLPTSEAMAARLLEAYAADWPQPVRDAITPKVLVDAFVPSAHGELTSARPALMAYALGCMGNPANAGGPLKGAQDDVLAQLKAESVRDTLSALVSLNPFERRALRDIAAGDYTCAELKAIRNGMGEVHFKNWEDEQPAAVLRDKGDAPLDNKGVISVQPTKFAALIGCLREKSLRETDSDVVRLQPPYAALLTRWMRRNGGLAVSTIHDIIYLDAATRSNLVVIADERDAVTEAGLWAAASEAFCASMHSNGVGFREASATASGIKIVARTPASAEEFYQVPALEQLNAMLSRSFRLAVAATEAPDPGAGKQKRMRVPPQPTLLRFLEGSHAAVGGAPIDGASFQERLGVELILALHHFHSHAWGDAPELTLNGMTAAVVAEAVDAVVEVLAAGAGAHFVFDPDYPEMLTTRKRLAKKRAT